jgi:hypothetical protein
MMQTADEGSPLEVLPPVLFNTYKHHAGALRVRIRDLARQGEAALDQLTGQTVVLGTKLMDLYTGSLWPIDISRKVIDLLTKENHLALPLFRIWIAEQGGYAVLTLPEDDSRWVLRLGEDQRYVHLHPGRWSPATLRVRANVLKTAFAVLVSTGIHGGDPMEPDAINRVRAEYLKLPPLGKAPEEELGLGVMIDLLRRTE